MDIPIAAHAIAVSAILATADNAFDSVAGLARKENWATDYAG
jgi:predicted nucleic acid-binding protein